MVGWDPADVALLGDPAGDAEIIALVDGRPRSRRNPPDTHHSCVHHLVDGLADPFGCGLDFAIREMGVAQRHAHVAVAEQPRDHRHWHPVHHRVARKRVTQIVQATVFDVGFPPDPVPEREVVAARAGRVERRRKHEGAPAPRLPFDNAPGLRVEGNFSRSRLAVGQHQHFAIDLGPAQPHDLAPAAAGQQEQPDDVGLPLVVLFGLRVQDPVQAADFLPRQEACQPRPSIPLAQLAKRRHGLAIAASRHALGDG